MSRFLGRGKLGVGLLDDDALPAGDEVVTLPEEPAADSVETQLLEVEASGGDVADVEEQVEEAAEVAEGLEELRLTLKAGLEEGGVSKREASAIIMAANRMVGAIGGDNIATPGLEHFGSHSQRLDATRVAMESIGDKIKEIWKKILAQLEKAYEWIRKHMLNVFGAGQKLVKRAEALKKAADDNDVAKPKENKIKRGALVKELASKGTGADSVDVATLANMTQMANEISVAWPELIGKAGEAIATIFENVADNKGDGKVQLFDNKLNALFSNQVDLAKAGLDARDGTSALASDMLPGGMVGIAFVGNSDSVADQTAQKIVLVKADKDFGKNLSNEELNTLDKKAIKDIADSVAKLGNYLDTYRKADNKFKTVEERIKKAAKRVGELVGKEKEAGSKSDDDLRAIQKLAIAAPDLISGFPAKFYTFAVGKAKHFLDYAELSLAEYKAKD